MVIAVNVPPARRRVSATSSEPSAAQALELAHEVETALRGPDWRTFLHGMYGNEPARWDDSLRGADRLRCIVNALTRIRFCTDEGVMDFASKDGVGEPPEGFMPWFEVPGRRTVGTPIAAHAAIRLPLRNRLMRVARLTCTPARWPRSRPAATLDMAVSNTPSEARGLPAPRVSSARSRADPWGSRSAWHWIR